MATIKVNGKTISYTKVAQPVITDITFSDGVTAQTIGSSAAAAVLKAYKDKIATPPVTPPVDPPVTPPVVVEGKEISYDEFAKLSNAEGLILKVKAGTYNYGATNSNLKNCTIDLTGVVVQNTNSALRIVDKSVNVNYKGLICKNISGYQVEIINKQVYTGAEGTFVDRLILNGFSFDGGGQPIHSDGNIRGGKLDGVLKSAKILNTTIKNIPNAGDMIYIGMGIDVEVGYATFYNVNTGNNNHNGLIRVHGNVLAHHIVATNYQGNVVRNWLYSGEGVKTTEVHNVIGYKSRKYVPKLLQKSF